MDLKIKIRRDPRRPYRQLAAALVNLVDNSLRLGRRRDQDLSLLGLNRVLDNGFLILDSDFKVPAMGSKSI